MKDTVLEVKNLTKKFGKFTAVNNISFDLKEGEVLGLLGPNGAGKTTTLQMILGVLTPTTGEISYYGKGLKTNREEVAQLINFSSTYTNLPWALTVKENLLFLSYLYDIPNRKDRIEKIVKIFKLGELLKQSMNELSAGQLTRVNLAKSFLNFPKVLLLDEPTASLDPDVAEYVRSFLLEQRREFNVSIIITSHNMAEVEEVADRVIFIDQGKVIADDTPVNLSGSIEIVRVELVITDGVKRISNYCDDKKLSFVLKGKSIVISISEKGIPNFLNEIMEKGITYKEISIEKPTLEDYFLQVVTKKKK